MVKLCAKLSPLKAFLSLIDDAFLRDHDVVHDEVLLIQLEALAEKLGVKVRHENLRTEESSGTGGLCRIDGDYVLFLDSRATIQEKIRILTKVLKGFDLRDIYVRPALRELLEEDEK